MPSFLFCACQPGAERMLKAEVQRWRPALRPAFARPGLVTWKTDRPVSLDEAPPLVFARASGRSLGAADGADAAARAGRDLGATRVHAWGREGSPAPWVRDAVLELGGFAPGERPRDGEVVLDLAVAPDEPWFLGAHRHGPGRSPFAGGLIPVEVPADAPSRAYRKIEEAIVWSGARPRAGETALEFGSAPGGASHALLRRGLQVTGVDPGEMAEVVAGAPGFRHLRTTLGGVRREDLPRRTEWLLLDVNLAPQVALHAVRRIVPMLRPHLRGAFLTLKLNEERFAAHIPAFLERVRGFGFEDVRATQLPSNRSEICVYARAAPRARRASLRARE